jgi:Ca2+-binding EF-hand superfamily protein
VIKGIKPNEKIVLGNEEIVTEGE